MEGKEGKAQGVRGEGEGAPRHGSLVPLVGADGEEGKSPPGQGREGSCGGGVVFGWGRKAFGMQASEGRMRILCGCGVHHLWKYVLQFMGMGLFQHFTIGLG